MWIVVKRGKWTTKSWTPKSNCVSRRFDLSPQPNPHSPPPLQAGLVTNLPNKITRTTKTHVQQQGQQKRASRQNLVPIPKTYWMEDEWTDQVSDYIQRYTIPMQQKDREIKGKIKGSSRRWGLKSTWLHGALTDLVQKGPADFQTEHMQSTDERRSMNTN